MKFLNEYTVSGKILNLFTKIEIVFVTSVLYEYSKRCTHQFLTVILLQLI